MQPGKSPDFSKAEKVCECKWREMVGLDMVTAVRRRPCILQLDNPAGAGKIGTGAISPPYKRDCSNICGRVAREAENGVLSLRNRAPTEC